MARFSPSVSERTSGEINLDDSDFEVARIPAAATVVDTRSRAWAVSACIGPQAETSIDLDSPKPVRANRLRMIM